MQDIFNPITTSKPKVKVPKFKGKAKIELFENGQKVKEIEEENMFTNALDHFYNPSRTLVMQEPESNWLLNKNIKTSALGGILLYEDEIEENPDTFYAPMSNTCVGCASGTYSGSYAKRGSLNSTESGWIDTSDYTKGYRWVFDFPTDKANGKISCICLTSTRGGQTGFGGGVTITGTKAYAPFARRTDFNVHDSSGVYNNSQGIYVKFPYCNTTSRKWAYMGQSEDGYERYVLTSQSGTNIHIDVFEFKVDEFTIGLLNTSLWNDVSGNNEKYRHNRYTFTTSSSSYAGYYSYSVRDNLLYIVIPQNRNCDKWEWCTFNIDTRKISAVTQIVISPSAVYSSYFFVPFNGGWLTRTSADLYYYPKEGGNGTAINFANKAGTGYTFPDGYSLTSLEYDGGIIFARGNGGESLFGISNDLEKVMFIYDASFRPEPYQILKNGDVHCPTALSYESSSTNGQVLCDYGEILTPYLATINNLVSPVTKTNAQTMKITYEVTLAEGIV